MGTLLADTDGTETVYLQPNGDVVRRWQGAGLCLFCGNKEDFYGCFCRSCPSCSREYLSDRRRCYREFDVADHVVRAPAFETCDECAADQPEEDWSPAVLDWDRVDERDTCGGVE